MRNGIDFTPCSYTASFSFFLASFVTVFLRISGLDRRDEGAQLLANAQRTLMSKFGERFEPVQETTFYLALVHLPRHPTQDSLTAIEGVLLNVSNIVDQVM